MLITWDERKRASNLDKHGLNFADLTLEFFAQSTVVPTKLRRLLAIGSFREVPVTVVFAALGSEAISVISMRPSNEKERAYAA